VIEVKIIKIATATINSTIVKAGRFIVMGNYRRNKNRHR
jgi:hypothetical protein